MLIWCNITNLKYVEAQTGFWFSTFELIYGTEI